MVYQRSTGIYCIRNKKNGKRYIGSAAISLKQRWWTHRTTLARNEHHNQHLQHAWNKYGKEAFEFLILELCLPSLCITREQFWLDKFKSYKPLYGYNLSPTAGNTLGVKLTEEARKKISVNNIGKHSRPKPKESVRKMRESLSKVMKLPEVRNKLRESALRAYQRDPSLKERLRRATLLAHQKNPELIQKMRIKVLGDRYGKLVVIQDDLPSEGILGKKTRFVICRCDCGNVVKKCLERLRHTNPRCSHRCCRRCRG